jgi:hypothetical protein
MTELMMGGMEGLPLAVVAAGLLEGSVATLMKLDVRCAGWFYFLWRILENQFGLRGFVQKEGVREGREFPADYRNLPPMLIDRLLSALADVLTLGIIHSTSGGARACMTAMHLESRFTHALMRARTHTRSQSQQHWRRRRSRRRRGDSRPDGAHQPRRLVSGGRGLGSEDEDEWNFGK